MKYEINKKSNGPLYVTEEDELKLNYRCKKEEQQGEGKGSCSSVSSSKEQLSKSMDKDFKNGIRQIEKAKFNPKKDVTKISKATKSATSSGTRMAKDIVASITGTNDNIDDIATPDAIEEAMHSDYMDLVNHRKLSGDKATETEYKTAWAKSFKDVVEKYKNKKNGKKN